MVFVTPFNEDGSTQSNNPITTLPDPPSAIRNLTATAGGSRYVDLNWTDSTGELRYFVYRVTGATSRQLLGTVTANVTTFRVTGLLARTTYRFVVVATNAGGTATSDIVTVTT